MQDPLSIISSVLGKILSGFSVKNLMFIVIPMVLLIALIVVGTKAVIELAPVVKENIIAVTELVQKINEVQSGFNTALDRIEGMQETIKKIEAIINKIPSRLLNDEEDTEGMTVVEANETSVTATKSTIKHEPNLTIIRKRR